MKKCTKCSNEQEQGNFCAKCGGKTEEIEANSSVQQEAETTNDAIQQETTANNENLATQQVKQQKEVSPTATNTATAGSETVHPEKSNQATAKVNEDFQKVAGDYWSYVVQLLKNPAQAFGKAEDEFLNGLINIIVYGATFGLSFYFLTSAATQGMFEFFPGENELPFFKTFFSASIYGLMSIACTIISIVIFEKIWIKQMSFKEEIAQYGGLLTPLAALNVLTILTGLMDFMGTTIGLLMLSLFLSTFITGILFIYEKINYFQSSIYKVYISIGMLLANMFIVYLMLRVLVGEAVDQLENIFDPYNFL